MTYRLSVLDQSPIAEGSSVGDALRNTIDLARAADTAGYHRFWMAEHHASPGLAGAAPEALIGPVALATQRIRVGSGGIMLPHYSPYKVAETFALLAAMAPGRIDLGIGRAPGSDQRTALALQRDRSHHISSQDFPHNLAELLAYYENGLPADHLFAPLAATMRGNEVPEVYLLGSSPDSARWAADAGLPYVIADFINSDATMLADIYRREFKPSARLDKPEVIVATWTIAAPSLAEAEELALPAQMMFAHLIRGELIPVPSVAKAKAWIAAHGSQPRRRRTVLGTPTEVRTQLDDVARLYGADELMLVNIMPDHAARVRSYDLIAQEYGLASLALAA
ncbi:Limonene 1,2-monooxygenase [Sphingomonas antarctica]|uniref:LLM class flavin-dependent oxidoreductase n=1 Tax=Sphingomonas antarctica TaxID=2040274 RepID=UPI0039EC1532